MFDGNVESGMDKKELRKELKEIWANVNYWLSFAEAKNAGILAINIACIAAVMTTNIFDDCLDLEIILVAGLLIAMLITLVSLTPLIYVVKIRRPEKSDNDNPLFYGDIVKYEYKEYLEYLAKRYGEEEIKWGDYEEDLAREIVENSKITLLKYRYFKFTARIDMLLILCGFVRCVMVGIFFFKQYFFA